jgi:oxidoreductase
MTSFGAVVIGATGAIGRCLVKELLDSAQCTSLVAITRRPLDQQQTKLQNVVLDNFDNLSSIPPPSDSPLVSVRSGIDVAFCCLGTTRKDAGSAEAFKKVDLEYVTNFAKHCKESWGVKTFFLVTSYGSKADSWFLYPQTKGQSEENVKELKFDKTIIIRPGLLDRGSQARLVEKVAKFVSPSIKTTDVARGMRCLAEGQDSKTDTVVVYEGVSVTKLFPFLN